MLTYTNFADLNSDILTELDKLNNQLMRGRLYSRRMLFEETERKTLQSLPLHVFEIKQKKVVTVMISMPPTPIGIGVQSIRSRQTSSAKAGQANMRITGKS